MRLKNNIPVYNYLIKFYGISKTKAMKLIVYIGAHPKKNYRSLSYWKKDSLTKALAYYQKCKDHQAIGQNLIKYRKQQIERKIRINSLSGRRYRLRLPKNGQRTRSNGRTAKINR
jgi:ribosomal protein S13